jgi:hypothetical protein
LCAITGIYGADDWNKLGDTPPIFQAESQLLQIGGKDGFWQGIGFSQNECKATVRAQISRVYFGLAEGFTSFKIKDGNSVFIVLPARGLAKTGAIGLDMKKGRFLRLKDPGFLSVSWNCRKSHIG